MQLRDSIQKKSKKLFSRTLHSLKHLLLFEGYEKLPRAASFRAFSCTSCREPASKAPRIEDSYLGFSGKWTEAEESTKQEDHEPGGGSAEVGNKASVLKQQEEEAKKKVGVGNSNPPPSMRGGGGFVLAKKMKELEMMELGDMEHVLDIEEALHYYSRLTSPVYAGIVDQFFMDMYADFTPSPTSRTTSFVGRTRRDLSRKPAVGRSKP